MWHDPDFKFIDHLPPERYLHRNSWRPNYLWFLDSLYVNLFFRTHLTSKLYLSCEQLPLVKMLAPLSSSIWTHSSFTAFSTKALIRNLLSNFLPDHHLIRSPCNNFSIFPILMSARVGRCVHPSHRFLTINSFVDSGQYQLNINSNSLSIHFIAGPSYVYNKSEHVVRVDRCLQLTVAARCFVI